MVCNTLQWYALRVQSRLAGVASATLCGKGYEQFLPLYRSRRYWSDRIKEVKLPLFPGYLFCRFDPRERQIPVLTTPGVIGIVGAGKTPIAVDEAEIEAVKSVIGSGLPAQPWPFLNVGTRIVIEKGALAGIEGVVTNADKVYRLVVSITLLQRSVAVEIDRAWARPLPNIRPVAGQPDGQEALGAVEAGWGKTRGPTAIPSWHRSVWV